MPARLYLHTSNLRLHGMQVPLRPHVFLERLLDAPQLGQTLLPLRPLPRRSQQSFFDLLLSVLQPLQLGVLPRGLVLQLLRVRTMMKGTVVKRVGLKSA